MSDTAPARANAHTGTIKPAKLLLWSLFVVLIVPAFIALGALYNKVMPGHSAAPAGEDPETALALRLQKVGTVNLQLASTAPAPAAQAAAPEAAAPAPEAAAPAPEAAAAAPETAVAVAAPAPQAQAKPAAAATGNGEALYKQSCSACHVAGVAGAPKFGDKAAWAPRIAQGMDVLMTSVIKGKNAMPPKGMAMSASEAELKATVEYMVNAAK